MLHKSKEIERIYLATKRIDALRRMPNEVWRDLNAATSDDYDCDTFLISHIRCNSLDYNIYLEGCRTYREMREGYIFK